MRGDDVLSQSLPALLATAKISLPLVGLGVVRPAGNEQLVLSYTDPFGATAYRGSTSSFPHAFRPRPGGAVHVTVDALDANPTGMIESRLRHGSFPAEVRAECAVRRVLTQPVQGTEMPTLMVAGFAKAEPVTAGQQAHLDALGTAIAAQLACRESTDDEINRLRRLEALGRLLPAFFRVLDIREIFDQLSRIAKDVLPHDYASIGILSDDLTHLELFAETDGGPIGVWRGPMPFPPAQTAGWLYRVINDLSAHPLERDAPNIRAGGRSSIRVRVGLDDRVLAAMNFTSNELSRYGADDLAVARRIAEFVALSLSHQRLAEAARLHEELRARAANLDLLDEVLASMTDEGDLTAVLARMSAVAQKVLPHDALVLTAVLPNRRQARVYASTAADSAGLPDVVEIPQGILTNRGWEHQLFDDLDTDEDQQAWEAARRGYRSALRVPIRLDGEYVAGVSFLSFSPARYKAADVPVARRIADRLTLGFARERSVALSQQAEEARARAARLESRVRALTDELDARTGYRRVAGESKAWRQVLTQATQVAATDTTALLLGESGTGKEVVARFLHRASNRSMGPFIALNCAALPEQLLEAELFGYERGAYTGATQSKPGQLEQAAGGTLFLDEVAEMSPSAQAKFLRVVQEKEFQRLGGTRVLRTDARIVAATNRDLERAISHGQFREDLYYRLNVFAIQLPALRDRKDDILPLTDGFLAELSQRFGRPPAGVSRDARQMLLDYPWPGNVRELRNILERAAILCDGGLITPEHLALRAHPAPRTPPIVPAPAATTPPLAAGRIPPAAPSQPSPAEELQSIERTMVEQALQNARFNKSKAAKALGLTRQQLYVRMRRYGLD
jgi:transcriptional regulator with GAF, ATPase, and Fis domain